MSGSVTVLIMAAGEGTRMRSSLPKVLHPVCGRPMVAWPIAAAHEAGADRVAVIVSPERDLSEHVPEGAEVVIQPEADGTGGAIRAASEIVAASGSVVVLSGDHPLVSAELIGEMLATHRDAAAGATVMTAMLDEPGSYGRIVRDGDGNVERIVEAKADGDATPEQLAIKEINTGTYCFDAATLAEALEGITNENAQGEYYLGDVLPLIRAAGKPVAAHLAPDPAINLGVNTRADLALVEAEARRRINIGHAIAGVTIRDPASTWIDADVEIEPDAVIEPGCLLTGATRIGAGAVVGPHTSASDARIGPGATILRSHLVQCEVGEGCSVGPFTYLRPGTRLANGSKAGAFVEIKNSEVGEGAKVPHLSYIGDAEVGAGANIGAGSITANYDGFEKHRTKIGANARIGVDTSLVAPVEVGDDAYTGAGSVIDSDVPAGSLAIERSRQETVEGFAERKRKEAGEAISEAETEDKGQ